MFFNGLSIVVIILHYFLKDKPQQGTSSAYEKKIKAKQLTSSRVRTLLKVHDNIICTEVNHQYLN